jgi:hypothetical protein
MEVTGGATATDKNLPPPSSRTAAVDIAVGHKAQDKVSINHVQTSKVEGETAEAVIPENLTPTTTEVESGGSTCPKRAEASLETKESLVETGDTSIPPPAEAEGIKSISLHAEAKVSIAPAGSGKSEPLTAEAGGPAAVPTAEAGGTTTHLVVELGGKSIPLNVETKGGIAPVETGKSIAHTAEAEVSIAPVPVAEATGTHTLPSAEAAGQGPQVPPDAEASGIYLFSGLTDAKREKEEATTA